MVARTILSRAIHLIAIFPKDSIIKLHIAVGFMPMTGRAARDPKVQFKFGPGGAPPNKAAQMEQLREEYEQAAQDIN
jgi:hypothetical protein